MVALWELARDGDVIEADKLLRLKQIDTDVDAVRYLIYSLFITPTLSLPAPLTYRRLPLYDCIN